MSEYYCSHLWIMFPAVSNGLINFSIDVDLLGILAMNICGIFQLLIYSDIVLSALDIRIESVFMLPDCLPCLLGK